MALATTATLPFYKQAKHLTTLKLYPGVKAGSVVTWGTPVDLATQASGGTGTFEAFQFNGSPVDVSLAPADSRYENMATERDTFDVTISEVAPVNGTGNLKLIWYTSEYIRVVAGYTDDGAASSTEQSIVVVGKRGRLGTGMQLGKNTDTLSLVPCGKAPFIGLTSAITGI